MKKGNFVNVLLVATVVSLLGAFAFHVQIKPTADKVVLLKGPAMKARSLTSKIEKALQAQHGVASVEVDEVTGRIAVGFDSSKTGPEALASTVTAAGSRNNIVTVMTVGEFREMTGRSVGGHDGMEDKCGCDQGTQRSSNDIVKTTKEMTSER